MFQPLTSLYRRWKYGDEIIVVSGLPRSGTSMMMKMLDAAGLPIMTDHERRPDEDNPKGYFEYERVKNLEKETDRRWVSEARGKVLKVISFLLKDLPPENFYRIIFMRRDLDEVVASQNKMLARRGEENTLSDEETRRIFQRHLFKVTMDMPRRGNVEMIEIHYAEAIAEPARVAARVNAFLGGRLDERKMAAVVDEQLYRNRRTRSTQESTV